MTTPTVVNGCPHTDRPVDQACMMCGKGICFECSITDDLDTQVVERFSFSSIDVGGYGHRTEIRQGIFCAKCYLKIISDPNYKLIVSISDKGKPNMMEPKKPKLLRGDGMPLWWVIGIYLMMPLFCLSFLLLWDHYGEAKEAYNKYLFKKEKAQRIVQAMGGI
jgi:hypothetical protein